MSVRSTFNSASIRPWIGDSANGIIRGPTGVGFGNKIMLSRLALASWPTRIAIGTTVSDPVYKNIYVHTRGSTINSWRLESKIVPTIDGVVSNQWGTDFSFSSIADTNLLVVDPGTSRSLLYKYAPINDTIVGPWQQIGGFWNFGSLRPYDVIGTNALQGSVSSAVSLIGSPSSPISRMNTFDMVSSTPATYPGNTNTYSKIVGSSGGELMTGITTTPSNTIAVFNTVGGGTGNYTITVPSTSPITSVAMTSGTLAAAPKIIIGVAGHNSNTGVCYLYSGTTLLQTITSPAPFAGERFGENIDLGDSANDNFSLLIVGTGQNKTTTGGKVYMYRGEVTAPPLAYDGSFTNPITTTIGTATQYFGKSVSALDSFWNQVAVSDPLNSVVYCLRKRNGIWTLGHA